MIDKEKMIEIGAILNSISFTKDNGLRLGFITQELSDTDKIIVQKFYQKYGYLLFKSNEFQDTDIPKENIENKDKTPSKRLRNVLFLYWKQVKSNEDFEVFYRAKVEKFIQIIKDKLD